MQSLANRRLEPEIMDDPQLETDRHHAALRALRTINWLSASSQILWPDIVRLARATGSGRLRILDVASGGGDVACSLARKAKRAGLNLELLGVDVSQRAVEYARRRALGCEASVRFEQLDVLREELPAGYDVVMCSLFLHHLGTDEAALVLSKMAGAAGKLVLVSDLRRCKSGLALAYLASRTLTRSKVVHVDAVRSVRAAFTVEEALALAERAGLHQPTIRRCWPCRFLLAGGPRAKTEG